MPSKSKGQLEEAHTKYIFKSLLSLFEIDPKKLKTTPQQTHFNQATHKETANPPGTVHPERKGDQKTPNKKTQLTLI